MRERIPRHRADKQPEYIPVDDSAWRFDLVRDEIEHCADDIGDALKHPFFQYHLGNTRHDMDAPGEFNGREACARDYLDATKAPEIWKLRRLDLDEWYEVSGSIHSGNEAAGYIRACRLGVVGVDGYSGPPLRGLARENRLSAKDMQTLHELDPGSLGGTTLCGIPWPLESLPYRIGQAVCAASAPPTDAEKKA